MANHPPPPPGFSRADLHVHTSFSDGTNAPEDVLNFYALHAGVHVFAITDHDSIDGALHARRFAAEHAELFAHLDVIVGEEVSTRQGHVIGLFLEHWIPPGMSAERTVAAIHEQGGLAVAPHPYTNLMRWSGLVGVGDLIRTLPFDAVETRNANFTEVFSNRRAARGSAGRACVGNSDGHFLDAVGWCYTDFPGVTAADLRQALLDRTTVVGGRCYGALTLMRFVLQRLRGGKSILPRRHRMLREAAHGALQIAIHEASDLSAAVISPIGRVDQASMCELKETLVQLAEARVGIVIDCAGIRLLSSAGITALVAGFKRARQCAVGFCLAALSHPCRQSLAAARLQDVFPRAASVAAARAIVAAGVPFGTEASPAAVVPADRAGNGAR